MGDATVIEEFGQVKWFSPDKGYGFITDMGGVDAFVHFTEIRMNGFRTLEEGQRVRFVKVETPKGLMAMNVVPII